MIDGVKIASLDPVDYATKRTDPAAITAKATIRGQAITGYVLDGLYCFAFGECTYCMPADDVDGGVMLIPGSIAPDPATPKRRTKIRGAAPFAHDDAPSEEATADRLPAKVKREGKRPVRGIG